MPGSAAPSRQRGRLAAALLVLAGLAAAAPARAGDATAVGAVLGAGAGALIGQSVGGRVAAVVGGMIGAFTGAVVGANTRVMPVAGPGYGPRYAYVPAPPAYGVPPPVIIAPPVHVVPPPVAYAPPVAYVPPVAYLPAPRPVARGYWRHGRGIDGRPIRTWVVVAPPPRYGYGYGDGYR